MKISVPKETFPGERRVALVPASVPALAKIGCQVQIEAGAGDAAGFRDDAYRAAGAEIVADRRAVVPVGRRGAASPRPGRESDGRRRPISNSCATAW